jgi:methylmalonyl-CoA/ethylmalonyl-CoA epimerase
MNEPLGLNLGPIWQIAFVVSDLEAVIHRWARDTGIGPWLLAFEHESQKNLVVRGVPTVNDVSIAPAYSGDVMIELIEQHDDAETVYARARAEGNDNLHHVAFLVSDMEATAARLEERGHTPVMTGGASGSQFRYYDFGPVPGVMTEIVAIDPNGPRGAVLALKESSQGADPFEIRRP